MLFNSYLFALFLPVVFILYWFVFNRNLRVQNFFLVVAGYVFYGWWDWRFLFLIAFSTLFDFGIGILLDKTSDQAKRKIFFLSSCVVNIGLLAFFKYFNFFIDNFILAFSAIGYHIPPISLKVILPVGISFYTFQSLSYTADIYRGKMNATRDLVSFAAFISFFPQLVAGPIERAIHLLPQFRQARVFDRANAVVGMRQILWGLFKKIVIADTIAVYVDQIFSSYDTLPGSSLLLGAVYFAVQIYCDFSGYSSIAIGTARLFGFSLMENFNYPYFSSSVTEFWRKWHISLTSWFRDYVYVPLGGNRGTTIRTVFNTLFVFALSGFWHGANWTFIAWGLLNGIYLVPNVIRGKKIDKNIEHVVTLTTIAKMAITFFLITITWVFFRSANLGQAFHYLGGIFSLSSFQYPVQHGMAMTLPLILILFSVEWCRKYGITRVQPQFTPIYVRWGMYLALILACFAFFKQDQTFIYFQF